MNRDPLQNLSLRHPAHFLALGFGSGLSPVAPGTMGTLVTLPLVCLLALTGLISYVLVTLVACVIGIWICGRTARDMGVHDHGAIVWDEVAGMLLTMIAVPVTGVTLLVGFVIFRVLDILKPWPISYLDKHVHGGAGIMADDILAGVMACLLMHLLMYLGWLPLPVA
ncbi:phosphatidylglycerophosphatase A [Lacimicrobium sp. SS2-24]|uniref:phosphatidylglycerophosphatase A family protein n=1 Tax=Lacimicrobium sp. SS2-24 TaxID=2005569 RepID=UPI000B4BE210|nr:phosphatidylglycerophosphatase A [Lacimicrobium sp. SS2-24]